MKILHITTDSKFISHAMSTFESVYPNKNTVWMLSTGGEINAENNSYDKLFSLVQSVTPEFLNQLKNFDLVVLHSLIMQWYPLIVLAPRRTKFAWLGWGYDYYNYVYDDPRQLLFKKTLNLENDIVNDKKNLLSVKSIAKYPAKLVINQLIIKLALKRIGSFSPVLKEDYDLVKEANLIPSLPKFLPWNYGSLEENLVANFIGERVTGSSILVGNNASVTNNHLEAIDLLASFSLPYKTKIFVPLSYGNESYKKEIITIGRVELNDMFYPITDFMAIDDYVRLIKQCGYVIMNHKRQQGLGNIVIMLYLGARIFLAEENPIYTMLTKQGAILNTMSELELNPKLLKTPLLENEIQKNIEVLYKHWSKETIDAKTRSLVEFHLGISQ